MIPIETTHRAIVLGCPIDLVSSNEALSLIKKAWQERKGLHIITLNAEMLIAAQEDRRLNRTINNADITIADGAGVVLALKLKDHHITRLPGIELAQLSLQQASLNNIPVALIGGSAEVLADLGSVLPANHPGLKLVFQHNGYFTSAEEQSIITSLGNSNARLVLVAMGVPKQEYFIEEARKILPHAVFIGVGGSFDIWTGRKTRAPELWQDLHLEWLYRLCNEPWRYKRMASALPKFVYLIIADYLKK